MYNIYFRQGKLLYPDVLRAAGGGGGSGREEGRTRRYAGKFPPFFDFDRPIGGRQRGSRCETENQYGMQTLRAASLGKTADSRGGISKEFRRRAPRFFGRGKSPATSAPKTGDIPRGPLKYRIYLPRANRRVVEFLSRSFASRRAARPLERFHRQGRENSGSCMR